MGDGSTLRTGLKEWPTVCRSLERGRQIFLLRKGGIYESAGEIAVEQRRFVLFPTYVHQKHEMLKAEVHSDFEPRAAEPERVELRCWCEVSDIVEVRSRERVDALGAEHVWTPPLIDMRFNYRPKNPLYLLLVRAYRLQRPTSLANTPAYAGCKSWVPLDQPIEVGDVLPALDDAKYAARRTSILERVALP